MPQVVCNLSATEHADLVARASDNRRTAGNQLLYEAFTKSGLPVPDYIAKEHANNVNRRKAKKKASRA